MERRAKKRVKGKRERREGKRETSHVLPYQRVKYQIWGSILEMSQKFPATDSNTKYKCHREIFSTTLLQRLSG